MTKENHPSADTNPDPLTGEPGVHPVGAVRGAVAGAMAGPPGLVTESSEADENEQLVGMLNELLETTRDAEFGFQACADEVAAAKLQQLFYHRAEQCHQAADDLVQLIWRFGGAPAEGGTAGGAMPRGWIHIKGPVGTDTDLAMLEECERKEDAALARYGKALAQTLPHEVRSFVERQVQSARRHHDQIRDLRNEARNAPDERGGHAQNLGR